LNKCNQNISSFAPEDYNVSTMQLHSPLFHAIFTAINKKIVLFSAFLILTEWLNTSKQILLIYLFRLGIQQHSFIFLLFIFYFYFFAVLAGISI